MNPAALNHAANIYLALTLAASLPPSSVVQHSSIPSSLTHVGQVGELADVQLFSIPKTEWHDNFIQSLKDVDGVLRVDVQEPRQRSKRDEF
ncbi:hypothetical protein FISHEDRAFT_41468 [Fistulina hepatica ATCC 64428]|nr:hypothetical protein FISHEDRAFT_41468 [Fistulina hepatica ATCC 64428]